MAIPSLLNVDYRIEGQDIADWNNSLLKFTSQTPTASGANLEGYFDWESGGVPRGREKFHGTISNDRQLDMTGYELVNPVGIDMATYHGTVSADGASITDGTWLTHGGIAGTWGVFRDAPEADVRGHNVAIVDGDTTPSTVDQTDFGSVARGAAAVSRTFTVFNTGRAAMTTSGLSVPAGFSIVEGLAASIAPGTSDSFTVRLNTANAGTFSGNVSFANNDSDENPYNFAIKGVIPGPEAAVFGNGVAIADGDTTPATNDFTDFGTVVTGSSLTRTFTVKNTGTAALTTSALTVPAGFTVTESLSASIAAGGSDTFTVKLNATAAGTFSGNVSFNNNDADEGPYNFAIKGVVGASTFSLVNGVLTVTGTSGNDFIRGSITNNVLTMKVNALTQTFPNASAITRIIVNALAGNDQILMAQSVNRPTSLNGDDGDDIIYGGAGADVINGGSGNDVAFKGSTDTVSLVEELLS